MWESKGFLMIGLLLVRPRLDGTEAGLFAMAKIMIRPKSRRKNPHRCPGFH